jgi:putative ABC transport system permease protein
MEGELEPGGNLNLIRTLMIIGFFILLIASINFMNLATAQSAKRAKEVGVRKVCGAGRRRIIFQFLSESILLTFISSFLSCVLVRLLLPLFNLLTNKTISLQFEAFWPFLILLPGLALLVGALSGFYPALFLSSYTPVEVLKKKVRGGRGQRTLRNVLVHLQYAISIALIFCTLVIALQLRHFRNHTLGFDQERVISVPLSGTAREKYDVFREEVNRLPGLELSTVSSNVPGWGRSETMFAFEGIETAEPYVFPFTDTDESYIPAMGMTLVSGRNFSKNRPGDRRSILVNETLVQMLGWESPLGKRVTMTDVRGGGEFIQLEYAVIGVVGDFHYESLHSLIRPHLIRLLDVESGSGYSHPSFLSVRNKDGILSQSIEQIHEIWTGIEPARPFEYRFLDDVLHQQYENEQRLGNLFMGFTGLAILIACLGLFGLSSFITEQRTKEIGIRKVLGASVSSVVLMLSREFSRWVLLANILAWPVAYFVMHRWLLQFAYRIDIGLWMFFVSGITALLIALSTVWFQTMKAALGNPVVSLRYE